MRGGSGADSGAGRHPRRRARAAGRARSRASGRAAGRALLLSGGPFGSGSDGDPACTGGRPGGTLGSVHPLDRSVPDGRTRTAGRRGAPRESGRGGRTAAPSDAHSRPAAGRRPGSAGGRRQTPGSPRRGKRRVSSPGNRLLFGSEGRRDSTSGCSSSAGPALADRLGGAGGGSAAKV